MCKHTCSYIHTYTHTYTQVALNGIDYVPTQLDRGVPAYIMLPSAPNIQFTMYVPPVLSAAIRPAGPLRGGIRVTITGNNMILASRNFTVGKMFCRFGTYSDSASSIQFVWTPVTYLTPSSISCVSPPSAAAIRLLVGVTFNGQTFQTSPAVTFSYYAVKHIHPPFGGWLGNTILQVSGDFINAMEGSSPQYECRFSSLANSDTDSYNQSSVDSYNQSSVDSYNQSSVDSYNQSSVSNSSMNSSSWNSTSSNSTNISNANVSHSNSSSRSNVIVRVVPATFRAPNTLLCRTPPFTLGTAKVSISLADSEFSEEDIRFEYIDESFVDRAVPDVGPLTGGFPVILIGTNFINSSIIACRFRSATFDTVVPGRFISNTSVSCNAPRTTQSGPAQVCIYIHTYVHTCKHS